MMVRAARAALCLLVAAALCGQAAALCKCTVAPLVNETDTHTHGLTRCALQDVDGGGEPTTDGTCCEWTNEVRRRQQRAVAARHSTAANLCSSATPLPTPPDNLPQTMSGAATWQAADARQPQSRPPHAHVGRY